METAELLKIIACPKCRGDLRDLEGAAFLCERCGLVYPIREGIPVLLTSEAIPFADWRREGGNDS